MCSIRLHWLLKNPLYYWEQWKLLRGIEPGAFPDIREIPFGVPLLTSRRQVVIGTAVSHKLSSITWAALIALASATFAMPPHPITALAFRTVSPQQPSE